MSSIALPGFGELVPLQRLLRLNLKSDAIPGTIFEKLDTGIDLAMALQKAGSRFLAEDSFAGRKLMTMKTADRAYLVHEYLHEPWKPTLFADTASQLQAAGLQFVGCAIGGISVGQVMRTIWPFFGASVAVLMAVPFIPELSLWLPAQFK